MDYVSWEDFFQYMQFSKISSVKTVQWVTKGGLLLTLESEKNTMNFLLSLDLARHGQTVSLRKLSSFSKTYVKKH